MAAKLEEALLSIRLDWDLSTPAKEIVEKVREQDLSLIPSLEGKCKNQLLPIAFKLAQGLKIPAVVALLLHGGRTILNSALKKETAEIYDPIKKSEGGVGLTGKKVDTKVNVIYKQGEPATNPLARKVEAPVVSFSGRKIDELDDAAEGTIVDLVLGMALAHSNSCILNNLGAKCKSYANEKSSDLWQGEGSSLYSLDSGDLDTSLGYDTLKRLKDRESGTSDSSNLKDFSKWDESFQRLSYTLDSGEWEEVATKSRKKSITTPEAVAKDVVNSKLKKTLSGQSEIEQSTISTPPDNVSLPAGDDGEYKCEIARKLLECVLLFSPRLSGHAQSLHLPPLLRAAQANDEALVCLLLDAWAPVNDKDSFGNTALHWALRQATPVNRRTVNSQVVRRLLKAGANVKAGNKLGATPVHTAAGHGHFEALSFILEKDSSVVNVLAITKETPLHYAVKNNHIACTFLLLKHGANRNVASKRDQKPIQLALSVEMRVLLLQDDKVLKGNTWESFKPILISAVSSSSPIYSLAMQSQTQFPSIADAFGFHQSTQDGNTFNWLSTQALSINSRDLILGSEIDTLGGKELVNLPQYKTVACHFFASSDGCARGSKCHFAHSEEEIIGVARVDELDMPAGGSQSDDGSDQSVKNFMTKLCTHHDKTGKCPHGVKCTFAHGMIQPRGAPSSAVTYIRPPPGIDTRPSSANSMGSSTGSEKGDDYSARKVFVGGLPHFIQSEDLWEFFEAEFGKVVDAVVISCVDADKNVRSRGFGFVVFNDPRDANFAVKRHYLPFRGKKVEVKQAMARVDYGEEPVKPNSPIPPTSISNSPTWGPSSPVIARSKELAPVSSEDSQRAWSASPSAVDWLGKSSEEGTESKSLPLSEMNNHLNCQHSVPVQKYQSQLHNFGPLFPQSSSVLFDAGFDRNSCLLDSGLGSISPSPSHSFSSPSSASPRRHHSSMYGSSIPYSNGTSFVEDEIDRPSQSFFSGIAGPSVYSYGSDPPAPTDDDKEFSDLLAMLQGGNS